MWAACDEAHTLACKFCLSAPCLPFAPRSGIGDGGTLGQAVGVGGRGLALGQRGASHLRVQRSGLTPLHRLPQAPLMGLL